MKLSKLNPLWLGPALLVAMPVWCQQPASTPDPTAVPPAATASPDPGSASGPSNSGDRMLTPPLLSGQSYPTSPASQERSNYLRGGVFFTTAYSDNAVGLVDGHPES